MIKKLDSINAYILSTPSTTYCFRVTDTLHLEHLYYGASLGNPNQLDDNDIMAMSEKKEFEEGNMVVYDAANKNCTLENMCLEMSSYGKGDIREPFVEIIHSDGSSSSDFLFDKAEISDTKEEYKTLPGSYFTENFNINGSNRDSIHKNNKAILNKIGDNNNNNINNNFSNNTNNNADKISNDKYRHLTVTLKDQNDALKLELHYYVYEDCDVICRSTKLINNSEDSVRIERLMSNQLDFENSGYVVRNFTGAWAREMHPADTAVTAGSFVNSSFTGTSSNRANPFIMLHEPETTEKYGKCYGLNLIYSGNHYECVQVNAYGKTRVVTGINPNHFSFLLKSGEEFEAPEAVMTFSDQGYAGVSFNMHHFVREHVVRGKWKNKPRPVLLNSWEAAYFDINESKLIRLAKAAKEAGVELFVMDDGWFGKRNDDAHSLGDWKVNEKKLPSGLEGLAKAVNKLGMDFGLWVEPEMVSVNSGLYRKHPEWVMEIPGKPHSEGRNQRILDLCNPDVCQYIIKSMTKVFSSANISYVKWDMNRIFSDIYSPYLAKSEQGEVTHRYVMGLYKIMRALTKKFPDILFEGCSAGGNRFDLGIMCYFPQIWASDNTDAICRAHIQEGISYGYPMSVMTAHLSSCPNHQTLREVGPDTRFAVAAFGIFGLECNLSDMKKEDIEEIRRFTELYKEWREVLQNGDFYRGRMGNLHEWTCVSKDKRKAVGMILQEMVTPNMQYEKYTAIGLNPEYRYHLYNIQRKYDIRKFGDLINTAAPIHVKQDSMLHNVIAKFVTMPGESEDTVVSGQVLMNSGIKLKPAYSGTGYNENTRYFQDFCSRLYFMEAVEERKFS